jgi:hypothetical protein
MLPLAIAAPVVPAVFTDQAIALLVAVVGATVPVKVSAVPTVAAEGTPVMPVTATKTGSVLSVEGHPVSSKKATLKSAATSKSRLFIFYSCEKNIKNPRIIDLNFLRVFLPEKDKDISYRE